MSFLVDPEKVQSLSEGKAHVDLPKSVFYNPVQEFNRDLTIAVIRTAVQELSELPFQQLENKQSNSSSDCSQLSNKIPQNNGSVIIEEVCLEKCLANVEFDNVKSDGMTEDSSVSPSSSRVPIGKEIRILEALAASGLRSVRFALEIPCVREVVANDFDRTAVEFIRHNAEKNGVAHLVKSSCADASMVMY